MKHGDGLTLSQLPTITPVNVNEAVNVAFGSLLNLPGSGPNDTIEIFVKFRTANRPLVLSGRPLILLATLKFDAGSDASVKRFVITGPLLKPLVTIVKTVEVSNLFQLRLERQQVTEAYMYISYLVSRK